MFVPSRELEVFNSKRQFQKCSCSLLSFSCCVTFSHSQSSYSVATAASMYSLNLIIPACNSMHEVCDIILLKMVRLNVCLLVYILFYFDSPSPPLYMLPATFGHYLYFFSQRRDVSGDSY